MKKRIITTPFFIVALFILGCKTEKMIEPTQADRTIIIEGQSNAAGVGPGEDLPSDLLGPIPGAKIFYGDSQGTNWNAYTMQNLQYNVNNDGSQGLNSQYRNHHGIELRLFKMLHDYFGGNFNLLKFSEGGTSLARRDLEGRRDWSPETVGEMYDLSNQYRAAGVQLLGGKAPTLYIWGQGEDDANAVDYGEGPLSGQYQGLLTNRIADVRSFHEFPTMPFYIIRLGNLQTLLDTTQRNIIRAAQNYVAAHVPNVYIIDADGLPVQSDGIHYTSASYDTLAHRVFNAIINSIPIIRPLILLPFNTASFAELGYDATNTDIIQKIYPNKMITWKPNRVINGITGLEAGERYLAKIAGTARPGDNSFMPQY